MYRNPALLALAKGMPCKIRVPGVCCGDRQTVVACHSNQSRHGKAGWLKAHDWATAWGAGRVTPISTRNHWRDL
ncbi:DUF1364 family protein [Achromobacter denitrificans]|uniref:DUF1364 family protein n=2 Tax=Achromobacter denitrificans TaxID=32002 RepID=A0A6N0JX06_ACHDE|nr:DUF1364 family protein [Achromobacter denitrificans]